MAPANAIGTRFRLGLVSRSYVAYLLLHPPVRLRPWERRTWESAESNEDEKAAVQALQREGSSNVAFSLRLSD